MRQSRIYGCASTTCRRTQVRGHYRLKRRNAMNILNRLSVKNLRLNKKRTISTIIGILLSTALICAVATMASSFQKTLMENAINESGYYHIKLLGVTGDDVEDLKSNRDVRDMYVVSEVGYAFLKGVQNVYKPYAHLYSIDKSVYESLGFDLVDGRFPENEKELLISRHISTNGELDLKIGDTLTLEVGSRILREGKEEDELGPSNPYDEEAETLRSTETHTFKIVGIMERPNYNFELYGDPGYTVLTTNLDQKKMDVYISLKNPKEYKTAIAKLLGAESYEDVESRMSEDFKYKDWQVHAELLRWEAFAFSDSTVSMLYAVIGVVIAIILITSIFCIRNSFAIATTEKMKMYGMLSSVGATKKQIKKSVIFEAMILGLIGIPLGIGCGLLADFILLKIVNALLGDILLAHVEGIVFSVAVAPILLSVLLGLLTIYLSAISSARKAAKVSPLEQLRNSGGIQIKNKSLKAPGLIGKVFKMGGILAWKNLKRSRRRYRTTVVSIAVSIFVFIAMNVFITNAFDFTSNYYTDYDYNLEVFTNGETSEEDLSQLLSLDNIEESFRLYHTQSSFKIKDETKIHEVKGYEIEKETKTIMDENGEPQTISTGEIVSYLEPIGLDSETFEKYCRKIGVDYEKVKDGGILCDTLEYYEEDKTMHDRRYTYQVGDVINGTRTDHDSETDTESEIPVAVAVAAIAEIQPYGMEHYYYDGGFLILDIGANKSFDFYLYQVAIQSGKPDQLERDITKLNMNFEANNLEKRVQNERAMILVIKIFLYGFIAVITLIGVTNIFNTITSNMELRQKEFAMLKSVGMTKPEFNRMINLETLFLGSKALLYGIIAGLLGTLAMYKAFSVKMDSEMYIPIQPILISILFVFILVFIIMRYSIGKINRQNTIETIRKENI